jgi:hypothetical protein
MLIRQSRIARCFSMQSNQENFKRQKKNRSTILFSSVFCVFFLRELVWHSATGFFGSSGLSIP